MPAVVATKLGGWPTWEVGHNLDGEGGHGHVEQLVYGRVGESGEFEGDYAATAPITTIGKMTT